MAEVRDKPAAIHNVGGCEQDQLDELTFADYKALGREIVRQYNFGHYSVEVIEQDGKFSNYLTFDCRSFLRPQEGGQADA